MNIDEIKSLIRDVHDFPKPGIVFRDITPLLANPRGTRACAEHLASAILDSGAEELLAIESRGFVFGAAVAAIAELPFHLVRKAGKLPYSTVGLDYALEYGTDRVEIHTDAITVNKRYAVIDDLIATGGTAGAAVELVQGQGGTIACCAFLIELSFLQGRQRLGGVPVSSLITY